MCRFFFLDVSRYENWILEIIFKISKTLSFRISIHNANDMMMKNNDTHGLTFSDGNPTQ